MKRLLLPLLALFTFPTVVSASPYLNTLEFNSKVSVICDAFNKEYLTKDQRNDLLIDAYISFDDNYKGTKATRIKSTRNIFSKALYKGECLRDLETYVIENIYPELK
tara:strand:+ start:683 stop:1003 length:321 start_codon:yes stop_codon:yes gene_type:complete